MILYLLYDTYCTLFYYPVFIIITFSILYLLNNRFYHTFYLNNICYNNRFYGYI